METTTTTGVRPPLIEEWNKVIRDIDHRYIESLADSREIDVKTFDVISEDIHETKLACRLLLGQIVESSISPKIDEKLKPHLERVDNKLDALQSRLERCTLKSLQRLRELLTHSAVTPEVTCLSRHPTFPRDLGREGGAECVLTISVYSSMRPGQKCQTFDIIASHSLDKLREKMSCPMEKVVAKVRHIGANPWPLLPIPDPPQFPDIGNSYFLIEGVAYTNFDRRDAKKMDQVRWNEISFRLDEPYCFVHCGCCEHYIIMENIRQRHPYDFGRENNLPIDTADATNGIREIFRSRKRRRRCTICESIRAVWIAVNDRLAPENPCLYCDGCYKSLHYDRDGRLLYSDFKIYPYYYDLW